MASLVTSLTFPLGGPSGIMPTVVLQVPGNHAVDVPADTPLILVFTDNGGEDEAIHPDTIVVTVDTVTVFTNQASVHGWLCTFVTTDTGYTLTLTAPDGFAYGATVDVGVSFEYG